MIRSWSALSWLFSMVLINVFLNWTDKLCFFVTLWHINAIISKKICAPNFSTALLIFYYTFLAVRIDLSGQMHQIPWRCVLWGCGDPTPSSAACLTFPPASTTWRPSVHVHSCRETRAFMKEEDEKQHWDTTADCRNTPPFISSAHSWGLLAI